MEKAGRALGRSLVIFVGILMSFSTVSSLPSILNVGLILPLANPPSPTPSPTEFGYLWALKVLNKDPLLLPNTTLVPYTLRMRDYDSFRSSRSLCHLLATTPLVSLLSAPSVRDPSLEWKVTLTSAALDIPLLLPNPGPNLGQDQGQGQGQGSSINLGPAPGTWTKLLSSLIESLRIPSVALLYQGPEGLAKLSGLLRSPHPFTVLRKTPPFLPILKEVKSREIRHLLIDCDLASLPELLKAINTLQMTDYKYHYILTNLDLAVVDMSTFVRSQVNLTAFQIVNPEGRLLQERWVELKNFGDEELNKGIFDRRSPAIYTDTALAFDSVMALGLGLSAIDASHTLRPMNLSCDLSPLAPWPDGLSLSNYITSVDFKGLSGQVTFKEGKRTNLKMDVVRLALTGGWKRVGFFTNEKGLNITKPKAFWDPGVSNVTLVVTCVLEKPYVQLREGRNLTGNDRFEGFSIELLKKIAEKVHFKYVLEVVPDGKYGVYDHETGEWNGVVRQLIDKSVDLAIGAITINYARESVIDFTKPFMNLGISILFKKPSRPPIQLFSFLNPLALEIWLSVLVSYVLVSVTMYIVARFSPHEWSSSRAARSAKSPVAVPVVRSQFTLANAFWYPIGTLMQQGSDLNPKTASTRIVGGAWWFFSIIIVSSYTANLAAFLTVERMTTPIESAEDLAEQSEIAYGTLESGSTMTFFRDSKIETFQKMWRFMESKEPSVFASSYAKGIQRVLEGNYAFLMESTTIEYVVKKNCNLTQIGGLLDSKDYGIALPIGSPWRDKISLAILEMQEYGVIQQERNRWWGSFESEEQPEHCKNVMDYRLKDTKASALGVQNIGGIFVVLFVGLVIAIFVAIMEFCWNAKSNAMSDQVSLCTEMAEEAKFAFQCRGPRRRPALTRHCGRCRTESGSSLGRRPKAFHDYHTYPHQHHHDPLTTGHDHHHHHVNSHRSLTPSFLVQGQGQGQGHDERQSLRPPSPYQQRSHSHSQPQAPGSLSLASIRSRSRSISRMDVNGLQF